LSVIVIRACKSKGIKTTASFIFGSIDDTAESIDTSIDFAMKLDADYALFNVYTAHPGTIGYREAVGQKLINEFEVDIGRYLGEPAGIPTICRHLTRKQIHIKKAEAYIKFYQSKRDSHYDGLVQTYQEELELLRRAE
jgi:anaerobic magnesium-protoporphyrin IX monomethyl ester cyclase